MRNAELRDAAAEKILEHLPFLRGHVVFDYTAFDLSNMVMGINLIVSTTHDGYNWIHENRDKVEMVPNGLYGREGYMGRILDRYCTHEPEDNFDFVCGGLKWVIGDGDDSLAVTELEPGVASVWVRSWGE